MMTPEEELKLIEGCLRGDRVCQHDLYARFAGRMYAVCLRYCKNEDEAKDVLQDGFVKIFENLKTFKQVCPLEFWIRRIIINTALKYLRKQKRSILFFVDIQERDDLSQDYYEESPILSQFSNDELIRAVQRLATGYQLVFNLYAVEGYSHKEIGELLGISENTSKSQYARARKHLRNYLEQLNHTPVYETSRLR